MSYRPENDDFGTLSDIGFDERAPAPRRGGEGRRSQPEQLPRRAGWWKTGTVALIAAGVIVVPGTAVNAFAYFEQFIAASAAMKVDNDVKVEDPGKAEVVNLNLDMTDFPITVTSYETKASNVKVGMESKFDTGIFGIEIPLGSQALTRAATVEAELVINPQQVAITYDPNDNQLTISAPKTALSTQVDIPTGGASTTKESSVGLNNFNKIIGAVSEGFQSTIDKATEATGLDPIDVPLAQEIADSKLTLEQGMEKFADFYIVTQVDQECTPLITQIPHFTDQLKNNIRIAVQGKIVDLNEPNDVLGAMLDDPDVGKDKIKEVIADAKVEIPEDFEVGPDESNQKKLDAYTKLELFETAIDKDTPIECGVKDSIIVEPSQQGGSNE